MSKGDVTITATAVDRNGNATAHGVYNITVGPGVDDQTVNEDSPATFDVKGLEGVAGVKYQWFVNRVAVSGATDKTFVDKNTSYAKNDRDKITVQLTYEENGVTIVLNPTAATLHVIAKDGTDTPIDTTDKTEENTATIELNTIDANTD